MGTTERNARIDHLLTLKPGWYDGDQGDSVSSTAADIARELVAFAEKNDRQLPNIYPTIEGGLSLEWNSPERVVTIEILNDGTFDYTLVEGDEYVEVKDAYDKGTGDVLISKELIQNHVDLADND